MDEANGPDFLHRRDCSEAPLSSQVLKLRLDRNDLAEEQRPGFEGSHAPLRFIGY